MPQHTASIIGIRQRFGEHSLLSRQSIAMRARRFLAYTES